MLKYLVLASTLMAALNLNAQTTEVPKDQVQNYIKAVQIALAERPLTCNFTTGNFHWNNSQLSQAMNGMKEALLNSAGNQPVLVLKSEDALRYSFNITTSSDFKEVVSVEFQQSECKEETRAINKGSIVTPLIEELKVTNCKLRFAATCIQ